MSRNMFLEKVMKEQQDRVLSAQKSISLSELQRMAAPPRFDFDKAIRAEGISIIAEVKRASPSKGDLAPGLEPARLARAYQSGGARAVSVLTEPNYFKGSVDDLKKVRESVTLPVLRKDFICDPYQIWEAAAWGADAVLLIVAGLERDTLKRLLSCCAEAGLAALVEAHSAQEAQAAAACGARIIGINSRNLKTLQVDKDVLAWVKEAVPQGILTVAESGIGGSEDLRAVKNLGYDAALIGETLVKSADPAEVIQKWLKDADSS